MFKIAICDDVKAICDELKYVILNVEKNIVHEEIDVNVVVKHFCNSIT